MLDKNMYAHSTFCIALLILALFLLFMMSVSSLGYSIHSTDSIKQHSIIPIVEQRSAYQYSKPTNYQELVFWYQTLEKTYPNYVEVFKANELYNTGIVNGGYDLYYVRITNESTGYMKPEVLFLGSPHGDETAGTVNLYWFTDWLMRKAYTAEPCNDYDKEWLQWLIDHREIYIEICHNPYGFDHHTRFDKNGWDLNREADYDGPGPNTGGIWESVSGKTLKAFINNHLIRVGCDFHGGTRALLYPWSSTHGSLEATSTITDQTYSYVPPDFHFFDTCALRLGEYIGSYGGSFTKYNTGTIPFVVDYEAPGGICPWAYGANIDKHPTEDPYVQDEIFGNYPGSGILWITPELSYDKNPSEESYGNDTREGYGAEVRRYMLHQTDIAQPYIRWQGPTEKTNQKIATDTPIQLSWQVNGSLVVDHTHLQWGQDPDPITNYSYTTKDFNEYEGKYTGGTGWHNAKDGSTNAITYSQTISIHEHGEYYFVATAQVDQIYQNPIYQDHYGTSSYLRIIRERTDDSYQEQVDGSDGIEHIQGQSWWYSPIIHLTVYENQAPQTPAIPNGNDSIEIGISNSYSSVSYDTNGDMIQYGWQWNESAEIEWSSWFESNQPCVMNHTWYQPGVYHVRVKARDINGAESKFSSPFTIRAMDTTAPKLSIIKPTNGMYIANKKIIPFFNPVIIGDIDVIINAEDLDGIKYITLAIDEVEKINQTESQFEWTWEHHYLLPSKHVLFVFACDNSGNIATKTLNVWKYM